MPRNKTVKLKTPGLTLKRKILGVWAQSPHEEASHFLAYPCTDSYEEPHFLWFNSHKVGAFYKVLQAKPWSLTLYGLRQAWYNIPAITGDRPTHQCDPSTVIVPYGMGLVSSLMTILYDPQRGF